MSFTQILSAFLLLAASYGMDAFAKCPGWLPGWLVEENSKLPLCPKNGNSVLTQDFPVLAYVVGGENRLNPAISEQIRNLIVSIFTASSSLQILGEASNVQSDQIPLIYLRASDLFFEEIREFLNQWITDHKEYDRFRKVWNESLLQVSNDKYLWNRDLFLASFDSLTGMPLINSLDFQSAGATGMPDRRKDFKVAEIARDMHAGCEQIGFRAHKSVLREDPRSHKEVAGGNLLSLPGGLCAHLNNQDWSYLEGLCGDSSNDIEIENQHLSVGHIDEVLAVVNNYRNGVPRSCRFSLIMPSLEKGFNLLDQNKDDPFLLPMNTERPYCSVEEFITSIFNDRDSGLGMLLYFGGIPFIDQKAIAKNNEVASVYNNDLFIKIRNRNSEMQKWLDNLQADVTSRIESRLPECKGLIDVIKLPNLMMEDPTSPGEGFHPVFPNSVNLLQIKNTVLVPQTFNSVFDHEIEEQFKSRGITTQFLNTLTSFHPHKGEIHCATQELRVCRPK